jgi:hypothetical protein
MGIGIVIGAGTTVTGIIVIGGIATIGIGITGAIATGNATARYQPAPEFA